MISSQGRPRRRVRTIFVSDIHLGCKYSQAAALLAFLSQHEPEYIYLVGDIIDGWQLRRRWHWEPVYNQLLKRLLELAARGTQLRYTPGNHDDFLRHFLHDFGFVDIADEFIHYGADERRYLILHGDKFDNVEIRAQWLSVVGGFGYELLMWVNSSVNGVRRLFGFEKFHFSAYVKRIVKHAVKFVSNFEERLAQHARESHCDGVVCGHIHTPTATRFGEIEYFNTGDWVENRTSLIEYSDGVMEILHLPHTEGTTCVVDWRHWESLDDGIQENASESEEIEAAPEKTVRERRLAVPA